MTEQPFVTIEKCEPGIAVLRLNRPTALNAFTMTMMADYRAALTTIDADPDIRVVVLIGEGRGFCAGLDLKSVQLGPGGDQHGAIPLMALQEHFGQSTPQMRRMRQPIIAAIRGPAVGMGFALALAADIRIAGASAKFLIGAVKIGLSAGETGISYHLPRLIGAGRAFEIMLTGRPVAADEALAIGLVSRLVDDDALLEAALETARTIAANSPYAVKHTKQIMWSNLDAPSFEAAVHLENHTQVVAMLTDDFAEATQAFAEKRPPVFKGR